MSEPFLGTIMIWPINFSPRGWAFCEGQTLAIGTNTALYSLLGTTYGGNGQTTFALPDLRGRIPVGAGQGPGLSPYTLGQKAGTESVTLQSANLPPHSHACMAYAEDGTASKPSQNSLPAGLVGTEGRPPPPVNGYAPQGTPVMLGQTSVTGQGIPFDNHAPYLALNFAIALEGIYPSRN